MTGSPARGVEAAMILCAGLGTRLRPLTDWLAKPMVPIGDRPAVAHVADHVRASGIARIVVNVHHRPEDLRAWAREVDAAVSEEPELLGTAGGLHRAASRLGAGPVLVWNGDILAKPDLAALLAAHRTEATLAITARRVGEGNVGLDAHGRIVRLRKESFGEEVSAGDFTGIHVVGEGLRAGLPTSGCLVGDVYLPALRRGAHLSAHVLEGTFTDVGSLGSYVAANRAWLGPRASWQAPTATVHAPVEGCIVGARARVEAEITRSIVWPNTVVREAATDAVLTPFGRVLAAS